MIERGLRAIATGFAIVSGFAVLALAFAIVFDIVARRFFAFSVQGTDEYGGYVLATIASLGLSYALLQRGHTRVDIVMPFLSTRLQAAVNLLALATLLVYAAFVAWYAYAALAETIEFDARANSPLQTPLWAPQLLWVIGTWTFVVVTLWAVCRAARLIPREPDTVNRAFGPLTAVQEVTELKQELERDARRGSAPR
jgi:TRAP-type C4-dicarboxylate transport system permease small subunit